LIHIGIDPGISGAIALYAPKAAWLEVHDMPVLPRGNKGKSQVDGYAVADIISSAGASPSVMIERASASPGAGVASMFNYGFGAGVIEGVVCALNVHLTYVTPATWKKHFRLTRDKGLSRSLACQRFPKYSELFRRVKDDGRAEAALLALYHVEAWNVC